MRAAIDRCIKRNTWEINSWKSKGVQCGTESHPKVTGVGLRILSIDDLVN